MMNNVKLRIAFLGFLCAAYPSFVMGQETSAAKSDKQAQATSSTSTDVSFQTHDGVDMFGRLVLPQGEKPHAIVVYVQTAEGATIDMKRPLGGGKTFNYFDLYRVELLKRGIGFFSYEGRGIRMGDDPPRYEKIDRDIFNTSTLANKAKDVESAIETIRKQPGLRDTPVFLMGASEGTLIAAEAASRNPAAVQGLILYGVLASNMKKNFAFICSDGDFMRARPLDKDNNGAVTKEEWDSVVKTAGIDQVDKNGDGLFTVDDVRITNKKLLDAVDKNDFATLQDWGKTSAAVALPNKWFEDHFAHSEIWSFLKGLNIPVGIFQGDRDNMTSMAAVKELEKTAKETNRTNLEFHYFEGLDHSLNIGQYFVRGNMPAGHQAIFRYIDRIAPK
jgi:pimeloyl-ACP methyl ester carboxylesterase